ncbi:WXG100 family type VII secretion target [Nocardia sp. NPDC058176]|uniref:WXG100 family type VII secretion target n=1 Tax=Nocardia sp. NPDC058176 TaxID=3346368 RepID=UPI0036DB8906
MPLHGFGGQDGRIERAGRVGFEWYYPARSASYPWLLASWTGTAAESYQRAWGEMQTGSRRVWDELFELAEKWGVAAENFQTTDMTNAGHISSLDLPDFA